MGNNIPGLEQAYHFLFVGALVFLAAMVILCLIRAIIGPRIADRVVAVNMMGTMVMVIIAILALFLKEGYLVDICLIYAMISFLAVIILTKVYMGVYAECMQHKGGRILRAVPPKSESAQPGAVGIEGTEPEAGGIADILPDKKQCGEEM